MCFCTYALKRRARFCLCNDNGGREKMLHSDRSILFGSNYADLYNNQINARALIGKSAMFYCASKLMEISRVL